MSEDSEMELKQALITVIATAACMGIDVDVLCQEASEALSDTRQAYWLKQFVPGAIDQIRHCTAYAKGFDLVDGDLD